MPLNQVDPSLIKTPLSGVLGGSNSSVSHSNSFVIGSNINSPIANTLFVNNLSATGTIYGAVGNSLITSVAGRTGAIVLGISDIASLQSSLDGKLNTSGGTIGGNLTISGNLTATGTTYFANTVFSATSALSVVNIGVGPALYVSQGKGTGDIASFYDADGVEALHIGNAKNTVGLDPNGVIGIKTSNPNKTLTVVGEISSTQDITTSGKFRGDGTALTLPLATASVLGVVKQGANISIAADGTISGLNSYVLPTATPSVLGGVRPGLNINVDAAGIISSFYPVSSVNGRTGNVVLTNTDVGAAATSHTHPAANITGLSTVATTGSYNDLTNRPSLQVVATSGSYSDLLNKPVLVASATTDTTNASNISSGTLAVAQGGTGSTSASGARNNLGISTVGNTGSYADLTNRPILGTAADKNIPATGNASTTEVVYGSDTRLTDSRNPNGSASGDLTGSYPSPTVSRIRGVNVDTTTPTAGQVLTYNGTNWAPTSGPTLKTFRLARSSYAHDTGAVIVNDREIKIWGYALAGAQYIKSRQTIPITIPFNNSYLHNNPTVTVIDCVVSNSALMALLSNGTVWVCGPNEQTLLGASGVGNPLSNYAFNRVPVLPSSIVRIEMTGDENTNNRVCAALTSSGALYVWGNNTTGSLGVGVAAGTPVTTPTILATSVSDFRLIGEETQANIFVLKTDGTLWASGYNGYGNLGIGTTVNSATLVKCKTGASTFLTGISSLASSAFYNYVNFMVTDTAGNLWISGYNGDGRFLDGTLTNTAYYFKQVPMPAGQLASRAIIGAMNYFAVLSTTGNLYTWGQNLAGELGISSLAVGTPRWTSMTLSNTNVSQVNIIGTQIAASYTSSFGVLTVHITKTDGRIFAVGGNTQTGYTVSGDVNSNIWQPFDQFPPGLTFPFCYGPMLNWGAGGLSTMYLNSDRTRLFMIYPYNGADADAAGFTFGCPVTFGPVEITQYF